MFPPFSSWKSCIRAGKEQSRPKRKGKERKEYAGESMASFKDSLYAKTSLSVGIQVSTAASLSSERDCLPFFPPPRRPAAVKCRAWALISFQFCLLVLHSQRFFSFSFERSRLESPRERHPISGILHSLSVSRSIRTSLPSFSNPPATFFSRRFLAAWERNAVVTQLADEFVLRPAKVCLVDRVELFTWPRTSDRDVLDTNLVRRTSFERVAPLLWEPPACCQ